MTSQAKIYRYQLLSKNALTPDETELYELTHLTGVVMDPNIFKIIIDLIRMNVAPTAIERMLKSLISQQNKRQSMDISDNNTIESVPPAAGGSMNTSSASTRGRSGGNRPRTDRIK